LDQNEVSRKDILNWSINDYLGLANHPEVRKADADAALEYGAAYPMVLV
jgi:glycine C-acetyltransferase